jgi:hypothetical protein
MTDPVTAVSAVSSVNASQGSNQTGYTAAPEPENFAMPPSSDVAAFQAFVEHSNSSPDIGSKIVSAGVNLSERYADRMSLAHEFAEISPDEFGGDDSDYMRAMLAVQVSLNEVTMELQSTAQIANSVKDSFNNLYRMQG